MKKTLRAVLLTAVILFPLACGKNLSPVASGSATVVPTSTITFTPTMTPPAKFEMGGPNPAQFTEMAVSDLREWRVCGGLYRS
jgi:hypothetical protein